MSGFAGVALPGEESEERKCVGILYQAGEWRAEKIVSSVELKREAINV